MSECTPEFWTLKDIRASIEKGYNGNKKIVIPMFQRGKRWDKDKKETFIDSLRKKYPIGTLLFYKDNDIYTLIDGLQRATAIKDYLSKPSRYFSINDFSKQSMEQAYIMIFGNEYDATKRDKVNQRIEEYVRNLNSFDKFSDLEFVKHMMSYYPCLSENIFKFGEIFKKDIENLKDDYSLLCNMSIPAIVYTGDESTLPEIFERINSKGVPLTEYEIYAASWPRKEFKISNDEILNYVLKKYDALNDSEYAVKDYDREKKRISKTVNAFEYVFALSKYLQRKYNSLNFYRNLGDDETNPVSFQLLNACFNSSHKQIKEVHKIILRFEDNIDILENKLFDSIEFVNNCIDPILKFKGNNRKDSGKIFHSQYQIMSLISFSFRMKYNIYDDNLNELDSWKSNKEKLQENIWKYYVLDIITKYWSEGGTGKIHLANTENRYLKDITQEQFSLAYDSYTENMYGRRERKNVTSPSTEDYVLLNTIYLNSFSAMDQLSIDKFDVEHIATKDQMKKLSKITGDRGLPISHFANLCYLPEYENRAKGSNNFYQDNNYLIKSKLTIEDVESKYSFTNKDDLDFMDLPYSFQDYDVLLTYFKEFLKKRNSILKVKFLKSLGYTVSSNTKVNIADEPLSMNLFTEDYLNNEKMGKLVINIFKYLVSNNLISNEDVVLLKTKEGSSNLGSWKPILIDYSESIVDVNGYTRYYADPIKINGNDYYLCKEWIEESRKKFVPWARKKLLSH